VSGLPRWLTRRDAFRDLGCESIAGDTLRIGRSDDKFFAQEKDRDKTDSSGGHGHRAQWHSAVLRLAAWRLAKC
jgi:hypothetical protein